MPAPRRTGSRRRHLAVSAMRPGGRRIVLGRTVRSGPLVPRGVWLALLLAGIAWVARDVLGPFVVAAVLAYAFSPLVQRAVDRTGWRRGVVVALGYALALGLIGVVVALVARPLARDLADLSAGGPDVLATTLTRILGRDAIEFGSVRVPVVELAHQLQTAVARLAATPSDALHVAAWVGEAVLDTVLVLIVTFYLLLDAQRIRRFALGVFEPRTRRRVVAVTDSIHATLGRWLRGQLLLVALVALVVYLALGPVLHVKYALAIAVLTGVLEIIPLVGPIIAAALAATVAFAELGTAVAVVVIVFYVVLRQIEDQVVMPLVVGRAVHLHPVVTIFAVLVGLSTWGVLGGLLAVPVAAALNVALAEVYPEASSVAPVGSPDVLRSGGPDAVAPTAGDDDGRSRDHDSQAGARPH